ncbi:MAG: hypothetical protein HY050_00515 [Actinobacteria bacterium]|nr:hypothetical protein [Actinomycetota bacterium]
MDTEFEKRYQQIVARKLDPRDSFLFAVKTTKIFCLPNCPSRMPNKENVLFFESGEEAQVHGYRACKRCRPHSGSQLAVVEDHAKIILECRMLITLDPNIRVARLAGEVSLSERQLRRIISRQSGLTIRGFISQVKQNALGNV